ncbi:restriction endonuclease subunit S [Serratia marcescens]|uniref:restriction endonuclease subunit S n=1 Tax=Serratia TaxID=613 RepID=UPI0032049BB5
MSAGKLPEGWVNTTIGDTSVKCSQRVPDESEQFIYVDIGSINRELKVIENPQYLSGKDAPSRARKEIKVHDIIVSLTRPNLNAVALVSEKYDEQIASTGFEVIRPTLVESRYIFALVRSRHFIDSISGLVQGALYPAAKSSDVQSYEFPLPPLAEQKIIAEKLDTLLAQVDNTKARLEQIPQILKRFRQAVLATAVNGKLTEKWRGSSHLQGWQQGKLGDFVKKPSYGTSSKSSKEGLVPVLRMGNIQGGKLDWTDLVYTSDATEIKKYKLEHKDVLFNRTNSPELVGKTAIYNSEQPAIYAGYLIRVQCLPTLNPDYLNYHLNSFIGKQYCHSVKSDGVSQSNINAQKLIAYPLHLPPLPEQHEIVRRVEQLFAYADTIEKQVNNALARVNSLTQSLLAKAFRGELTAQWRAENPDLISGESSAAALLEKIKAERAASGGKKTARKKA